MQGAEGVCYLLSLAVASIVAYLIYKEWNCNLTPQSRVARDDRQWEPPLARRGGNAEAERPPPRLVSARKASFTEANSAQNRARPGGSDAPRDDLAREMEAQRVSHALDAYFGNEPPEAAETDAFPKVDMAKAMEAANVRPMQLAESGTGGDFLPPSRVRGCHVVSWMLSQGCDKVVRQLGNEGIAFGGSSHHEELVASGGGLKQQHNCPPPVSGAP